jgi:alpha-ribazole phosphatase
MEIYLIRHTAPAIARGVCYGQSDIDVTETFMEEAAVIRQHLPDEVAVVYSSPLQRCKKLATHLFPHHTIQLDATLMEINCGWWELQRWDDIAREELDPWMNDLVNVRIPGGESYTDLYQRCTSSFADIYRNKKPLAIVAHGGVIRSILSHITATPLLDSFKVFSLHYGSVVRVFEAAGSLQYQVLSNIPHEKETHKPSGY